MAFYADIGHIASICGGGGQGSGPRLQPKLGRDGATAALSIPPMYLDSRVDRMRLFNLFHSLATAPN